MQVVIKHNVNQRQQRGYQGHRWYLWHKFNKFNLTDECLDNDSEELPQVLTYKDDVLQDCHGGRTYQSQLGNECQAMLYQRGNHKDEGHPYLPWSNTNQIWVTNLIYTQGRMSMISTNMLLQGLKKGKARIESVNFYTAKKMFSLLDNADYVPVCSFYSWIYSLYI